jgi:glc operon protein GlcG
MGQTDILTADEAWTIAGLARDMLQSQGWAASFCVVNRHGEPLLSFILDGVRPFTAGIALLKARQSASTGRRTRFIRDKLSSGEWNMGFAGLDAASYCPLAGGVPIYDQAGNLLGGCGISNLNEDQDEQVAGHAVEKAGFASDLTD